MGRAARGDADGPRVRGGGRGGREGRFDLATGALVQTLTGPGPVTGDRFGAAVVPARPDARVGASGDDAAAADAGGVYRFAGSVAAFATLTLGEGGTVTAGGSFTDPGTKHGHTVLIDWGAGEATTRLSLAGGTYTFTAAHTYVDDNPTDTASDPYPVRVLDQTGDVLVADLAPAAADRFVRAEAATGAGASTLVAANASGVAGAAEVAGFEVGPDGYLYVARSTATTGVIEKYSAAAGLSLGVVASAATGFRPSEVNNIRFAADGSMFVLTAPVPGAVRTNIAQIDPATGTLLRTLPLSAGAVPVHFTIGAGNVLYYSSGSPAAPAVRRFDLATGEELAPFAALGLTAGGYVIPLATQDAATTTLTATNAAPAVTVRAAGVAGGTYTLSAVVAHAGTRDTFTYSWSITAGTATVVGGTTGSSFGFTPTGAVTVSLTATDDDGGTVTTATRVVFGTAAETITITNTTSTAAAGAVSLGAVGRVVVFGLGGADTITAAGVTAFPVELVGGAGADTLLGGSGADVLTGDSPGGYGTSLATATDAHAADSLTGAAGNDALEGGVGADTIDLGAGDKVVDGGADNDLYLVPMGGTVSLADGSGIDTIDLSAAPRGVRADLPAGLVTDGTGAAVVFAAGTAVENVTGTAFADAIKGTADRNILDGGGGLDVADGADGDDYLQGSFQQIVYLDFDTATGPGEHAYTVEERNLIQARLEAVYPAPFSPSFTRGVPGTGRYSTLVINGGDYAENELVLGGDVGALDFRNTDPAAGGRVNATGFLGRAGQAAATSADYVPFTAAVAAHELAHLFGLRHSDSFGPIGTNPGTGLPYGVSAGLFDAAVSPNETAGGVPVGPGQVAYPLKHGLVSVAPRSQAGAAVVPFYSPAGVVYEGTTPVAKFTVTTAGAVQLTPLVNPARVSGATLDATNGVITVAWAATPASSKVLVSYQYSPFRPVYDGPADAADTAHHITASPASVGSTVADALGSTYLGERELIKPAFADASTTRTETALPVRAGGTALPAAIAAQVGAGGLVRDRGPMPRLAVPNLLPAGTVNAGKLLNVRAAGVVGPIGLNTVTRRSENDVYAVQGKAGDLLTVEVLSPR